MNDPVVIEVSSSLGRPRSSQDVVAEALAAAHAGAAVFRWQARDPADPAQGRDPERNFDIYRGVRDVSDIVVSVALGAATRTGPLSSLRQVVGEVPEQRPDVIQMEAGLANSDQWDPLHSRFSTETLVQGNSTRALLDLIAAARGADTAVAVSCWTVGQVRTARLLQESGVLPSRALWVLVLSTSRLPQAAPATLKSLEAMAELVPPGQPWSVNCPLDSVFPLASLAMNMGGNVCVGPGDREPHGFNQSADVVAAMVDLVTAQGRSVATPAEARAAIGVGPPGELAEARSQVQ
jgi:uncharacterized protein (DUF849 family)